MTTTDTSAPQTGDASLRTFALVAYGLMLLACANGFTALVAVVLAYIKRDDARGTPYQSHFANVITVFWTAVVLLAVFIAAAAAGAITIFATPEPHHLVPQAIAIGVGIWCAGVAFAVWYLYRTIRGLIRAIDDRPYS
ncbi:MAG: DUF4870 family protein [Rhizomicrobium sp.]